MSSKKPRVGIGVVLIFLGGINILGWKNARLADSAEMLGYGLTCALFLGLGLWFILRGRDLFGTKRNGV